MPRFDRSRPSAMNRQGRRCRGPCPADAEQRRLIVFQEGELRETRVPGRPRILQGRFRGGNRTQEERASSVISLIYCCLLYTSDAADERSSVDLGGRRIIKK